MLEKRRRERAPPAPPPPPAPWLEVVREKAKELRKKPRKGSYDMAKRNARDAAKAKAKAEALAANPPSPKRGYRRDGPRYTHKEARGPYLCTLLGLRSR